ncbi:hypothetical protein Fot_14390 [Forsythia ovata]|uniref:Uncharacterized protein n=1 Tax=Forsythia ovata TaxID=205694 RepID=A0ABD1W670_9LAMI
MRSFLLNFLMRSFIRKLRRRKKGDQHVLHPVTILGRRSGLERRRAWRSQLKVESQDLALAEMVAKVETLEKALLNFRDSNEEKQIFEDGKHVGGMELLALIKDQHHDFNFGSLVREGEIVALALPIVDIEAEVPEPSVPSEVNTSDLPAASEAKTSDPPAQGTDLSVFEKFARLIKASVVVKLANPYLNRASPIARL